MFHYQDHPIVSELVSKPICHEITLSSTIIYLSKPSKCSYESIFVHTIHNSATQLSTMLTHLSLYYHEVFMAATDHHISNVSIDLLYLQTKLYMSGTTCTEEISA
jgi:hypothetical protein